LARHIPSRHGFDSKATTKSAEPANACANIGKIWLMLKRARGSASDAFARQKSPGGIFESAVFAGGRGNRAQKARFCGFFAVAYPLLAVAGQTSHTMKTAELIEPEVQTVSGENVIQIPDGLLGFEHVKKYVLLAQPQEAPFMWLRMIENADKRFLVISPVHVLPDYQPDISSEDVRFLGLTGPEDALVVNIVTLRPNRPPTVNLKGPIVINRNSLIAKQVIPNNASRFDVNHPLPV
jgi:flagellar assembly factor FliW